MSAFIKVHGACLPVIISGVKKAPPTPSHPVLCPVSYYFFVESDWAEGRIIALAHPTISLVFCNLFLVFLIIAFFKAHFETDISTSSSSRCLSWQLKQCLRPIPHHTTSIQLWKWWASDLMLNDYKIGIMGTKKQVTLPKKSFWISVQGDRTQCNCLLINKMTNV